MDKTWHQNPLHKGLPILEVEEDELGTPVTTKSHQDTVRCLRLTYTEVVKASKLFLSTNRLWKPTLMSYRCKISPDCWVPATESVEHIEITYDEQNAREVKLPLMTEQMIQPQKKDTEARKIVHKLHKEKINTKMFILHEGVLCRLWT